MIKSSMASSSRLLQFIFSTFLFSLTCTSAQGDPLFHFCLDNNGNYTANSTYSTNLKTILSSFPKNDYGFYNLSVGETTNDRVNAIALCRGDINPADCVNCLKNASTVIIDRCPNQKEAVIWYDACMLRYSNRSIFHTMETSSTFYMWNVNNVSVPDGFDTTLTDLLGSLRSRAAASVGTQRKYATGDKISPGFETIFALVQCTPDLSEKQCTDCLVFNFALIPNCCQGKEGGRVAGPSCNFRFETYSFYGPESLPATKSSPPPPPPPSNQTTTAKGKDNNTSKVVIITVASVVGFSMLIISIFIFFRKRKRNTKDTTQMHVQEGGEKITSVDSLQYDLATIKNATDDFTEANKLGAGGFGAVYRGTLPDGEEIAVKRLSRNSAQGDIEFKNEVLLVAKLQHRSLVRLLGFCLEGHERILIYEFVPNASLDQFIFDSIKKKELNWERRFKIIVGIARGLVYLHEDSRLRIIHRDLKASNILLDSDMNPKIADFGMARLFSMDQTQGDTSRIVGTYGYMAPEYAMHGFFSVKSDVFSFGVLVLEIMSGQKNNGFRNGENLEDLLSYAWRNWREGKALNLVDPCLTDGSRSEMMRCIHIGLLCVQDNASDRPTMASVLLMLNSFSLTLPVPSTPAFFFSSTTQPGISSVTETDSDESRNQTMPIISVNEASVTEPYPR